MKHLVSRCFFFYCQAHHNSGLFLFLLIPISALALPVLDSLGFHDVDCSAGFLYQIHPSHLVPGLSASSRLRITILVALAGLVNPSEYRSQTPIILLVQATMKELGTQQ